MAASVNESQDCAWSKVFAGADSLLKVRLQTKGFWCAVLSAFVEREFKDDVEFVIEKGDKTHAVGIYAVPVEETELVSSHHILARS